MARPKSDLMDKRNAPLRSHPPENPPAQGLTDEDGSRAAVITAPASLFDDEQCGRSEEWNQRRNRSLSPFKHRDHSELSPIQTSDLGGFIPKSSTGHFNYSDSDTNEERPFLSKFLDKSPFHSKKATIPAEEKQDGSPMPHGASQEAKDEEEYHKFCVSLNNSLNNSLEDDSPIDETGEIEHCDSMIDEQKDQVKLFRSSLLAGVKAQEDRRGRSKRIATPPDHLQVGLDMADKLQIGQDLASDPNMHDPIESKDSVIGVQENDNFSLPETLKPITSFQEESEESLDCLIKELEAEDGSEPDVDAITIRAGEVHPYPPSLLDTKANEGLDDAEVAARRKKYGWNRMKEQKRNHVIKFLSFFNGPVQWVMEVSKIIH